MTLGEKIKHYRTKANLTQKKLAEKMGYDPNAISNWERNKCEPNFETLKEMANIIGINPSVFFEEIKDYPKTFFEPKTIDELKKMTSEELTDYIVGTQDLGFQCNLAGSLSWHDFKLVSKQEQWNHIINAIVQYPIDDLIDDFLYDISIEGLEEKTENFINNTINYFLPIIKQPYLNTTKEDKIDLVSQIIEDAVKNKSLNFNQTIEKQLFTLFKRKMDELENNHTIKKIVKNENEKTKLYQKIRKKVEETMSILIVEYVSEWDGYSTRIETKAKYNLKTGEVFDIEAVDIQDIDSLDEEYIILPNGNKFGVYEKDGDYFVKPPLLKLSGSKKDMELFLNKIPRNEETEIYGSDILIYIDTIDFTFNEKYIEIAKEIGLTIH